MLTWLRALFAPLIAYFTNGDYVPQPQRAYLALGPGFTVTDDPVNNRTIVDVGGASTSGTFSDVATSELDIGSGYTEVPGVSGMMLGSGGSPINIGSWTVLSGKTLRVEWRITIEALVSGFGLLLLSDSNYLVIGNAGGGATIVEAGSVGAMGSVPPFGGGVVTGGASGGVLGGVRSGNTVTITIGPYSAPTWTSGHTYVGSLTNYSAMNPPTAIMGTSGCSVVSDGTNLYICTVGVSSASTSPTGTGSGAITPGDGSTWYYAGPASAGLGFSYRVNLLISIPG